MSVIVAIINLQKLALLNCLRSVTTHVKPVMFVANKRTVLLINGQRGALMRAQIL